MTKRTITKTFLLALLSLSIPLAITAQNTTTAPNQTSTSNQQSATGPLRSLRKKIRSMRPRIKRREARKNKLFGKGNQSNATTIGAPANTNTK